MSADIETQIRSVADAAFDQTAPVDRDRYVAETSPAKHNWWLVAAASVLVFALVGALALIDRSDDDAPTTPATQSDGDEVIDRLPFSTTRRSPPRESRRNGPFQRCLARHIWTRSRVNPTAWRSS